MRIWQAVGCAFVVGVGSITLADLPSYDHVVVVVEENHSLNQVMGSPSAPYLNSLAAGGTSFTNMFGITHPSQPNYLHLFSGSAQGVTDDSVPATFPFSGSTNNLGGALVNAGKSFVGYSETMPSEGYNGATFTTVAGQNQYVRKHNPWVNWQSGAPTGSQLLPSTNQPFTSFPGDFSTLPNVSFVVPNEQNDMHDGSIAQADTWLKNNIGAYATWAKTHNSLLVVTFDEDESASRNRIPTVFYGANVGIGQNPSTYTLHNVLRTLEDTYGVAHSGTAANVKPISGTFTSDWLPVIRSYQQNVNGYTSAQDTYFDSTAGQTSVSHGTSTDILVDNGSPTQQALIKFDNIVGNGAGQVAAGTKVFSAKLRIYTSTATNAQTPNNIGLYNMQRTWSDTDTYDSLVGGVSGSEVASSPSFTLMPNKQGVYVVFDVTDTVQSWVDGTATNYGWLLKHLAGTDGWRFTSSESLSDLDRPYLEIVVPEPTSAVAVVFGLGYLARRPRRQNV